MTIAVANGEWLAAKVLADVLQPPPPVDLEKWAIENVSFSERESPFPGPYNPDLFPYFSELLFALGPDDPCRIVTNMKSAQLGGTVLANIFSMGSLDLDPGDVLYVHPTEDNGRRWSRMKLQPMIRGNKRLRDLFPQKARDGGDSVFYKERADGRGSLQISGANSPASLSMISVKRQVQDDLSKWEMNPAGDPERQADSRSRAHEFAKLFKNSTPLVEPGCRITKNFNAGSQESFHVPCPHCGFEHTLDWENLLSNLDEDHPENAHFTCPDCGAAIEDHHRAAMIRKGRWVAANEKARRTHRSFHIWSAYSLLQSLERIAQEWLDSRGDPASEQVFWNDTLGRAFKIDGEAPPWEEIRDRAEKTGHGLGTIPAGHVVVTLGIDCQQDRIEWQAVAWARDLRRAVVQKGVISGHISEAKPQQHLSDLLKQTWPNASGRKLGVDLAAIDGNAWTEDVWSWAKKHPANRVIMVRGRHEDNAPLLARVKKERSHKTGKLLRYSKRFYNFGTSILKMALYRNLRKEDPAERGFIALPAGLDDEYYRQLTAERRKPQRRRDGFTIYVWVKDPNQANEMLDTMLQAEAAAIKYGVRNLADATWDRLEAERDVPEPDQQLDIEDIGAGETSPAVPPQEDKPAGRRRRTKRKPAGSFRVKRT
jgi:phage terminase large subunit GpA-like protein